MVEQIETLRGDVHRMELENTRRFDQLQQSLQSFQDAMPQILSDFFGVRPPTPPPQ
jgi:hypothetical protein